MSTPYCLFCDKDNALEHRIFAENNLFYARWDNFPISPGHAEIVPRRHIVSLFDLSSKELTAFYELLSVAKRIIQGQYKPSAFNIGVNDGETAGQTIMHLHVHLIPRYTGDVPNPRGGVRNILPNVKNEGW